MKPELLSRLPEILFTIGKAIGSDESLPSTLATISELVTELAGAQACSIMLADSPRELLLGKAAYGLTQNDISHVSLKFGEGIAGWVAQHSQSALIDDVCGDPRFLHDEYSTGQVRSLACVPLLYRDDVVGVLTVTSPVESSFTSDSIDLLQLVANTIALDIENIRLRRISVTDKLTKAYNRDFLDSQLPVSLQDAEKRSEPFSILMFDIDYFKKINDTHGHVAGDKVLSEVARRLRELSRDRDMLVRYGGDEFILLLPGANTATASYVANRMLTQLRNFQILVGETTIGIHMSAGVASALPGEAAAELCERADGALYTAKRNGRDQFQIAN